MRVGGWFLLWYRSSLDVSSGMALKLKLQYLGKKRDLAVHSSDTIESVKFAIQNTLGFTPTSVPGSLLKIVLHISMHTFIKPSKEQK